MRDICGRKVVETNVRERKEREKGERRAKERRDKGERRVKERRERGR